MSVPQPAPDQNRAAKLAAFDRLLTVMDTLREFCPWDKKQTMESLRHLTLEESYELSDAILAGNSEEVAKELGDVLLHLVFYAKIGSESDLFNIETVINKLCDKLIFRHPHIYGEVKVNDEEDVKRNWESLKIKEGNKSALSGVPSSLPSLIKAMRIQEKARGTGFDWDNAEQVWEKVKEEILELEAETHAKEVNLDKVESELGDVLFSIVNYARFLNINPDQALERTNRKFITRFQYMESIVTGQGKSLNELNLEEMEAIWQSAKSIKGGM